MKLTRILIAVAAFFLSVSPGMADVSYLYVGNYFNDPYSDGGRITASLTFGTPLAPNLTFGYVTPVSWWISDGSQTASNNSYSISFTPILALGTDSSGNINQWYIYALGNYHGDSWGIRTSPSLDVTSMPPTGTLYFLNAGHPGNWSEQVTPVPEPCSIALALTGVGALVARRRKKLLNATK